MTKNQIVSVIKDSNLCQVEKLALLGVSSSILDMQFYRYLKMIYYTIDDSYTRELFGSFILNYQTSESSLSFLLKKYGNITNYDCFHSNPVLASKYAFYERLLSNLENVKYLNIKKEVLLLKLLVIATCINKSKNVPNILGLSTDNYIDYKKSFCGMSSNYTIREKRQLRENVSILLSDLYHYTSNSSISILKRPGIYLQEVSPNLFIKDAEYAHSNYWCTSLKLFGNAYAEITQTDDVVFFGFESLGGVANSYFHKLENKISLKITDLHKNSVFVTTYHRQICSVISSLTVDFFKEFPLHLDIFFNLWNKSVLSYIDYTEVLCEFIFYFDSNKVFLESKNLGTLFKSIQLNKYARVNKNCFPEVFYKVNLNTDDFLVYCIEDFINRVESFCTVHNLFPPFKVDVMYLDDYKLES